MPRLMRDPRVGCLPHAVGTFRGNWDHEAAVEWRESEADESLSRTYPPVPPEVQAARDAEHERRMRDHLALWRWALPWARLDNWKRRQVLALLEVGDAG